MIQADAQTPDGLWVVLKLEKMKGHTLEENQEEGDRGFVSSTSAGWRLTVRADDKIDPTLLISLFRSEIEKASGASPAAMQPFYVYGVVVFEWRERKGFDDGTLLATLKEMVQKSRLKRASLEAR
ncbi:MAG TPA: hypothetical protein VMS77_00670 [Conexivisphaerales archaeon]|nr:hypothetical protein [Conexivisphaerales archaeon]